ncbi:MAG: hypothetical protein ABJN22_02755 [Litorimonas sp.]
MDKMKNLASGRSSFFSLRPTLMGIAALSLGLWATLDGLTPTINKCGNVANETTELIIGILFILTGFWQVWKSAAHSFAWSEDALIVRSVFGKTQTVKFSDLKDVIYFDGKSIYKFGEIYLTIYDWVSGGQNLNEKIATVIATYAPHLAYIPAVKDAQDAADSAGCLRCSHLCSPKDIVKWEIGDDLNFGVCPACGSSEAMVFGGDNNLVTYDGLAKWNESLLENLDPEEKRERLEEIRVAREKANSQFA